MRGDCAAADDDCNAGSMGGSEVAGGGESASVPNVGVACGAVDAARTESALDVAF